MERRWTISGAYATWTLTVRADPLDDEDYGHVISDECLTQRCTETQFAGLAGHFSDVINNCEFTFADEQDSRCRYWA